MTDFVIYPGIDEEFAFPPAVRQAIADSPEVKGTYVTFVDSVTGLPLVGKHVTIKVDQATDDISDIVVEDIV
jgi:hypothetical protein